MSEVKKNENATAPKVDTRKTEINKFTLYFNRLGIRTERRSILSWKEKVFK